MIDLDGIVKAEVESLERADVQKPDRRPLADDPRLAAAVADELDGLAGETSS